MTEYNTEDVLADLRRRRDDLNIAIRVIEEFHEPKRDYTATPAPTATIVAPPPRPMPNPRTKPKSPTDDHAGLAEFLYDAVEGGPVPVAELAKKAKEFMGNDVSETLVRTVARENGNLAFIKGNRHGPSRVSRFERD